MSLRDNSFRFGDFVFDRDEQVLNQNGQPVSLPPKAVKLLSVLLENRGRIVEKEDLLREVWADAFVEEGNITYTVRLLRKTLSDDPQAPRYIETVPKRGYRFIAEVTEKSAINGYHLEEGKITEASPQRSSTRAGRRSLLIGLGVLMAVVIASGAWLLWPRHVATVPQPDRKMMLAVLPFQNLTGDEGQEYFSDGLTEEMITRLGNVDPNRLGVIARTSVMHYKNNPAAIDQIGRELQVQYVLEGSVRRDANRVRVTAQLIQTSDQTHVWAREYDEEVTDLLSLQDEIAREVTNNIQSALGPKGQPQTGPPADFEAYDLYLKGQYSFNKRGDENLRPAIAYFEQSIDKDPGFARAYAGLAASYAVLSGYSARPQSEYIEKARGAAEKALTIDPNLSEAHMALALILREYDWDWQQAEAEFKRAIELNPNNATAHHWYAEQLAMVGRFDEALDQSEMARRLDPLSMIIATDNAEILYFSRQYDRAIQKLRGLEEMEPSFPRVHIVVHPYIEKGMFKEALADIEQWRKAREAADEPWIWAELAYLNGRFGKTAEAQGALNELFKLNQREPKDAGLFVWAYAGMGNKQQAFAWLEKAFEQHSNILTRIKVDPGFDVLRDDPRFKEMLNRVHLAD